MKLVLFNEGRPGVWTERGIVDVSKVALPLGRRHQELLDHGLLAPVDGVPWLGGRRVEFGGG